QKELAEKLVPDEGTGFFRLRPELEKTIRAGLPGSVGEAEVLFVLTGEVSSIYKKMGRARKVHNLVLMPDLDSAGRLSSRLEKIGNIRSDGRPILGLDSRDLLEICLETSSGAFFIPAHIWTPHFSALGSKSGFDSLEDCYGDLTGEVYALETGLSSDPEMNWRLSALDSYALVSNSDAHSPDKLGREANLLDTELSYSGLTGALKANDKAGFQGTIEFYPEQGKYHLDGHRACKARLTPEESSRLGGRCPVCGRKITLGVLNRVEQLADRPGGVRPAGSARPFERLVPLREILAQCHGKGPQTKTVSSSLRTVIRELGPEFHVLRKAPLEDISRAAGPLAAEALRRNRDGSVRIEPGYDGEYGTVHIFDPGEREACGGQMFFFKELKPEKKKLSIKSPGEGIKLARDGCVKKKPPRALQENLHQGGAFSFEQLNKRQLEAVTAPTGTPLMVVAGPGTGKTLCLTARVAYLAGEARVDPAQVLAVTFTNRAARAMKGRISRLLSETMGLSSHSGGRSVRVSTFHSFCLGLLTEWRGSAPVVLDEAEAAGLLHEAMGGKGPLSRANKLVRAISLAKAKAVATCENCTGPEDLRLAFTAYRDICRRMRALDYDDLILETLGLLKEDTG
ncbi:MAG: UvrD-helicase domain-containing protein, partial [Gemmatimonadota bacterium]|nr:UvrD-helicase domain-containing protein [Gemmatimonadota bacterium]